MMKWRKTFFVIIITTICLFILNIGLSYIVYGRISHLQFLRTSSKTDAANRNMLIEEQPEVIVEGDSIIKNKNNFELWRDKFVVKNQIGLLPISFKEEDKKRAV